MLKKIGAFFSKYLPYLVVAISVYAFFLPGHLLWAARNTTPLLQVIMFGMGLTLAPKDFIMVVKKPWQVLLIEVLQYLLMPLIAVALTYIFQLPPAVAVGVILVGSCPGGTASNVMTYIAGGDVPLSVTATSVSTLIAPFLTPLLVKLYAGGIVDVSLYSMFISIVKVVVIPISLGIILNFFLHKHIKKYLDILPVISAIGVLLVLGGTVAVNSDNIKQIGIVIFVVSLLHNVLGMLVGHFGAKLTKMGDKQVRAAAIEVGMQNAGLASNLALSNFEPISALAGASFGIWHNFTGAIYANIMKRKDAKAAAQAAADDTNTQ